MVIYQTSCITHVMIIFRIFSYFYQNYLDNCNLYLYDVVRVAGLHLVFLLTYSFHLGLGLDAEH